MFYSIGNILRSNLVWKIFQAEKESKERPGEVQVHSESRPKMVLLMKSLFLYIISFEPHNNMQSKDPHGSKEVKWYDVLFGTTRNFDRNISIFDVCALTGTIKSLDGIKWEVWEMAGMQRKVPDTNVRAIR